MDEDERMARELQREILAEVLRERGDTRTNVILLSDDEVARRISQLDEFNNNHNHNHVTQSSLYSERQESTELEDEMLAKALLEAEILDSQQEHDHEAEQELQEDLFYSNLIRQQEELERNNNQGRPSSLLGEFPGFRRPNPPDNFNAPSNNSTMNLISRRSRSLDAQATSTKNKKNPVSNSSCVACGELALTYVFALNKRYHQHCFRCFACNKVIDTKVPFSFYGEQDPQPLHKECYTELYGLKCTVCQEAIPSGSDGKVQFVKHPFFSDEIMCPSHAMTSRRCTACHRFEPKHKPFLDLHDAGRCVCWACARSVIVDSEDIKPIWEDVMNFMANYLGLPLWAGLKEIPTLVVGHDTLNDKANKTAHHGSKQMMTRGLCLSEQYTGRRVDVQRLRYNKEKGKFTASDAAGMGYTFFRIPDASKNNPCTNVTAVLILSGLPRDLAASILAHEATHAWFKMHPDYSVEHKLPPMVEEGCCQLLAQLFLSDGLEPASSINIEDDNGPNNVKLRQYFKYSIETDESEIYGVGFRKAAACSSQIGVLELLSHVVYHRSFPNI